jgi:holo-[acyl-carrier protein] synthase
MVVGIGIDLVRSDRIREAAEKWGKRFLDRLFTPLEQEYAFSHKQPYLHLAGRFAIKEAVFKAIGTGWARGVKWTDIEVYNEPTGRPRVRVTGRVLELMNRLGATTIQASISHDTEYSVGQVALIGRS